MSEDIKKIFAEALESTESSSNCPIKKVIKELVDLQKQHYYSLESTNRLKAARQIISEHQKSWNDITNSEVT
jgi:uncharacterized ubiquitin-like protein YukD